MVQQVLQEVKQGEAPLRYTFPDRQLTSPFESRHRLLVYADFNDGLAGHHAILGHDFLVTLGLDHGVPEHQVFDRVSWKDRNLTSFDPYGASPDFMSYVTRLLARAGYARPGFVGFSESAHPS